MEPGCDSLRFTHSFYAVKTRNLIDLFSFNIMYIAYLLLFSVI